MTCLHLRQLDRLQIRLLLGRGELDVHQLAGNGLAQVGQHSFEQHEASHLYSLSGSRWP